MLLNISNSILKITNKSQKCQAATVYSIMQAQCFFLLKTRQLGQQINRSFDLRVGFLELLHQQHSALLNPYNGKVVTLIVTRLAR